MSSFVRLLPGNRIEPDEFADFCVDRGWILQERMEDSGDGAAQYTWIAPDSGVAVSYVYDPILKLPYLVISHSGLIRENFSAIDLVVSDIRQAIEVVDPFEALDSYERSIGDLEEQLKNIRIIAASAPAEFDAEFFGRFIGILSDGRDIVRMAAIVATLYMPWRNVIPILEKIAQTDASDEVRALASSVRDDHQSR